MVRCKRYSRKLITLSVHEDVRQDVRNAILSFVERIPALTEISDRLLIVVRPTAYVGADGSFGFGMFWVSGKNGLATQPRIEIAAGAVNVLLDAGETEQEAVLHMLNTLAHEVAHYEQWRDGRKLQERGVKRRATSLVKKFLAAQEKTADSPGGLSGKP